MDLRAIGGSALVTDESVPRRTAGEEAPGGIPPTYVPARNTVLLALALGLAEVVGARRLVIGANAVDWSGYPDCRGPYLRAFESLASLATAAGSEDGATFRVHAPLLEMSKADIVRTGAGLGVPFDETLSCYDPAGTAEAPVHCGACDSCVLRRRGFEAADVPDPTRYASP